MGYKLAGFNVLGGVEIDPKMMALYRANHHPKHSYLMGVSQFAAISDSDLPPELFDLDILDGSPPCSSFSMAGSREKKWGKKTHFREGQARQVLDDLFFEFIKIADKLRPKVVVAENVKGLITGKARGYVKQIFQQFRAAGYETQLFLLDASRMGVPQKRKRTFFVARRADANLSRLDLAFHEEPISIYTATHEAPQITAGKKLGANTDTRKYWGKTRLGDYFDKVHPRGSCFNRCKLDPRKPAPTVGAKCDTDLLHWSEPRGISGGEVVRLQTFPDDYNFEGERPHYVCGMSVPPFMMQRVALAIRQAWFNG